MTKYAILALALAACTDSPTPTGAQTDEALAIHETDKGIAGTFGDTSFTSEMASDHVLDITIKMNSMVVTALVDFQTGVMEYDGYAADTGEDTQMTDDDRAVLADLEHAMATLGDDLPFALDKFRGFVATWAEHPSTVDLNEIRLAVENRSWTSLCYAKNSYYTSKHDCDWGGFGLDANTIDSAYLSSTG